MIRVPTNRRPTHPGEMLVEEFLTPMGIRESDLAEFIHVPAQRINEIIADQESITPSIALRLAKYFGNVRRLLDESAVALGFVSYTTS